MKKFILAALITTASLNAFAFEKIVNVSEYYGRNRCATVSACTTIQVNLRVNIGPNGVGVAHNAGDRLSEVCSRALSDPTNGNNIEMKAVQFRYSNFDNISFNATSLTCARRR